MVEVSIIIPVYNTEKDLHRCLSSIMEQSFSNFEVVMIDDGSNDTSGDICEEYANKDSRFRCIHQKNGGVSSARNKGLDNCNGTWVTFLDSDDWIDKDYLLGMMDALGTGKNNADVVVCNSMYVGEKLKKWHTDELSGSILRGLILDRLPSSMCCYMFRRECLGSLRVDNSIHHYEDLFFILSFFIEKRSCVINNTGGYHYRQGSQTHTKFSKKTLSGFNIVDKASTVLIDKDMLAMLYERIIISVSLIAAKDRNHENELDKVLKKRVQEYIKKFGTRASSLKIKSWIILIAIKPSLFYRIYWLNHRRIK